MSKKILILNYCLFLLAAIPTPSISAPFLWVGDESGKLGKVDIATGNVTVIGNMGRTMTDIAFDPSGNLYGIDFSRLYKIDKTTAAATLIGNLGVSTANSLVFDNAGKLYLATSALYAVDLTSGTASRIGNGGIPYTSSGDLAFVNGELFLSSGLSGTNNLVQLNTSTGNATLVGSMGFPSVFGLASSTGADLFGISKTSVIAVNPQTGQGNFVADYADQGLSNGYGSAFFSESGGVESPSDNKPTLTQTDSADPVQINQPFSYTVTFTNNATSVATKVRLTDTLPKKVKLLSVETSLGKKCSVKPKIVCNFGTVASGAKVSAIITVRPKKAIRINNSVGLTYKMTKVGSTKKITTKLTSKEFTQVAQ